MEQKPQNAKKNHSILVATARIMFAVIALSVVLVSMEFSDYLEKGKQQFEILKSTDTSYIVKEKPGHGLTGTFKRLGTALHVVNTKAAPEITVSRNDKNYNYRLGALALAKNMKVLPAIIGVLVFTFVIPLLAYRWDLLLKIQGVNLPFLTVLKLTYAGSFMNFFLIGTTGGDLVKAYWVGKFSPKRAEGFVSVFVDRFLGMLVLILLSAVLVTLMWHNEKVASLGRAVGILVVIMAALIVFGFSQRLRRVIRFDKWKHKLPISGMIDRIDQSLLAYRRSGNVLINAAIVTVILQLLSSTASYFLGTALQIDAKIWYYWLYIPLAFLIGSIPISVFWGVGLMESAYVAFFQGSGFSSVTQAAMLAMGVRLMQLLWSLPGSLVLAFGIGEKKESE